MPASTCTMPAETATWLALTVTLADAVSVMPADSSLMLLPWLSTISTEPGPSLSVIFWPPGVSTMKLSWPSWSSSVICTPLRERITFLKLLPAPSMLAGGLSLPFHSAPIT